MLLLLRQRPSIENRKQSGRDQTQTMLGGRKVLLLARRAQTQISDDVFFSILAIFLRLRPPVPVFGLRAHQKNGSGAKNYPREVVGTIRNLWGRGLNKSHPWMSGI